MFVSCASPRWLSEERRGGKEVFNVSVLMMKRYLQMGKKRGNSSAVMKVKKEVMNIVNSPRSMHRVRL